jgi:hypothetical protein
MPNYCWSTLEVRGSKEAQDAFFDFIGDDFDFNKFIPYPQEYLDRDEDVSVLRETKNPTLKENIKRAVLTKWGSDKDGFNSGGYEWCVANWGTKGTAFDVEVERDKNRVFFTTAWNPPHKVIEKMAEKFSDLRFVYSYQIEDGSRQEYILFIHWDRDLNDISIQGVGA